MFSQRKGEIQGNGLETIALIYIRKKTQAAISKSLNT